jgi:hypothetical protein
LTYCDAAQACINLSNDVKNCGTCGHACRATETCQNGTCACPVGGQLYCDSANGCVDTVNNTAHCGACDNACKKTQVCSYSTCSCTGYGQQYCASQNACIDTYSNNQHCGACDKACPTGTHCSYGTCYCDQATDTLCTDTCYNLQTDRAHCGSCTRACPGNYSCVGAQCKCTDPVTGTAVRVTTNTVDDMAPMAAWDGTHVGVVYARAISTTYSNLRFALLNADASVASDVALTNYTTSGLVDQPFVVWNGKEYAIVWVERDTTSRVMFLRLDASGVAKGPAIAVGTVSALHSPSVAWSPSYGGYAVVYDSDDFNGGGMVFRRIGADASNPEAANTFALSSTWITGFESEPAGTWGLGTMSYSDVSLTVYNADGSRTAAVQQLTTQYIGNNPAGTPSLIHDGTTWAAAWVEPYTNKILVNRGTALNSPQAAVTPPASTTLTDVILARSNGSLAIAWKQRPTSNTSAASTFRMQRFALPATLTSALTPIHGPIDILSTQNVPGSRNIALVSTGTAGMLGVWADDRWGAAREIYAAPIDVKSCP